MPLKKNKQAYIAFITIYFASLTRFVKEKNDFPGNTLDNDCITMSHPWKELGFGLCGGVVGQGLCHPFDTIKTRLQRNPQYNILQDIKSNGISTLYRGFPSPLVSVMLEKSVLFSSYDLVKNNSRSPFISGIFAGILTTFTVTPFERVKVCAQLRNQTSWTALQKILKSDGVFSLYRGWSATLFREVPGYGLYFWTYEKVKSANGGTLTPIKSFFTGASCGIVAWTFIYPSDPLKTLMQNENLSAPKAFKDIWLQSGISGFYRGFRWGIARAAILHGGVFLGYEYTKNTLF